MQASVKSYFCKCVSGRWGLFYQTQPSLDQLPLAYLGIGLASSPLPFSLVQANAVHRRRTRMVGSKRRHASRSNPSDANDDHKRSNQDETNHAPP